jgi:phosphoribosylamine-glycine ligase
VGLPCVVRLSASQGVLCAGDAAEAVTAARRIRHILAAAGRPGEEPLLVEEYLPGPETSIDGLVTGDGLAVTAVFDKPAAPDDDLAVTLLATLEGALLLAQVHRSSRPIETAVNTFLALAIGRQGTGPG